MPGAVDLVGEDADPRVAGGQPQGRARLHAGRAHPAALRHRREPDLDPRLGPAQQLPPARHQRPDRRLPLRQRRRLQRLRVAGAADHQAHRGLPRRQRAALRRQHARRRHQPRHQDRLRRRPLRDPQRGGLVRLLQELHRHRPGLRSARPLRRADRHRAGRLPRPRRADPAARLRHRRLRAARRHHAALRSGLHRTATSACRARSPEQELDRDPRRPNPTSVASAGRAQLRLHARRLHRCARRSARTRRSSGRRSSTTRTSTTRCASRSSTTRRTAGRASSAGSWPPRWPATATGVTVGLQYVGTRQNDAQFANRIGNRGPQTVDQINAASNYAHLRRGAVRRDPDASRSWRARAGSTRTRSVRRPVRRQRHRLGRLLSLSPKLGFLWTVAPGVQVYANASHAYEPPLLLELTAPGQIHGQPRPARRRRRPGSSRSARAARGRRA